MYKGIAGSEGIGIGNVVIIEEHEIVIENKKITDTDAEIARLQGAIEKFVNDTNAMADRMEKTVGAKDADILRGHIQMLQDPTIEEQITALIVSEKITAEKALDQVGECADPDECKRVADLGVDMLAAGIGNIHGKYPANWQGLSFETLDAIQQKTGVMPLVLHGGTGIPADMIKKAIDLGVSKINVNTECQLSFADATRKYIEAGKDLEGKGFDPRKLLAPGAEAIKATVKEKMELFGSVGKAE